ncbi:hypothetical protein [Chryseobacterium joostei]|uniref:hypothetical protein n=1 Tax=Chryseobacterium joostei TaxID=112234 RepID=UPI003D0CED52
MKYFISPDKEPNARLSEERLLEIISKYFPKSVIEKIDDEKRTYFYQTMFKTNDNYIDVFIPKTLDSVVLNTNMLSDLSAFITDIRQQFSKQDNVLLYDESYSYVVPIPFEGVTNDNLSQF